MPKIRVYRTAETVTDRVEADAIYKKIIHYWAYYCPACRRTYRAKDRPATPWAVILTAALEHPKYCPGNLVESLMESLADAMRGATQ